MQPGTVTVLADTALRADDLDEVAAQQAKEHAETRAGRIEPADFDFSDGGCAAGRSIGAVARRSKS